MIFLAITTNLPTLLKNSWGAGTCLDLTPSLGYPAVGYDMVKKTAYFSPEFRIKLNFNLERSACASGTSPFNLLNRWFHHYTLKDRPKRNKITLFKDAPESIKNDPIQRKFQPWRLLLGRERTKMLHFRNQNSPIISTVPTSSNFWPSWKLKMSLASSTFSYTLYFFLSLAARSRLHTHMHIQDLIVHRNPLDFKLTPKY